MFHSLTLPDDPETWARIRMVAYAIPDDVDLSDDADVIRALYAARFSSRDFDDVLDDAIAHARTLRTAKMMEAA